MLQVKDLYVNYGNLEILKDISLNIQEGEVVAVVGANGAGKTTLLETIAGLLKPVSGKIVFNSEEIQGIEAYDIIKKGLSLVPQEGCIFPKMSVKDNLEMGSYIIEKSNNSNDKIEWIYSIFPKLQERQNQTARTLSGGERKMLSISISLMSDPDLLLIDELSSGLAPNIMKNLFRVVTEEIIPKGITVLLVEQNVQQALKRANRAYVLENGKITLEGTSEEVMENEHVRKAYLGI